MPFLPKDASWLGLIVAILGILGGLYALRSLFWPACVRLSVADTVELVIGQDGPIKDFHLFCTFENRGAKTGVVQLVKAIVNDPSGNNADFKWQFFFEHEPGTLTRQPSTSRHAIAVRPGGIESVWIQFEGLNWAEKADQWWKPGLYDFEISTWVNAETPEIHPHTTTRFKARVKADFQEKVNEYREEGGARYFALEVTCWSPLEKCIRQRLRTAKTWVTQRIP